MDPLTHSVTAWDGLPISVREWPGGPHRPILCLPGLVRTGADFDWMIDAVAEGRRAIAIDYAGRGASGRTRDVKRYGPEACLRDVMDVCAAMHVHRPMVIGTSFGGLLAMGLAAARPTLPSAIVLNDIGPELGREGSDFVRDFVAHDPALPTLEACVALLRAKLPPLSIETEEGWRHIARLTYQPGPDGRYHPVWDTRIAKLLQAGPPDLWPLWDGLAHLPLLLIRGEVSNILLPETVERMRSSRPDMQVVTIAGVGHVPTLAEGASVAAIRAFLGTHA